MSAPAFGDTEESSTLTLSSRNGTPFATLQDFTVGGDGTITGSFTGGVFRTLGRIILSTFANPQGLVDSGKNLYKESNNSGAAQVFNPGAGGAGTLFGGALELSNVELSEEFINLIAASTGFSASSRVLSTGDRLTQDLIATIR
jgi:flagellar hook protein FlgE